MTWPEIPRGRVLLGLLAAIIGWPLLAVVLPRGAPLGVVVLGLIFGSVYGLLALGLVLVYRANRIINFAYGGMGAVSGIFAVSLYVQGHLGWWTTVALSVAGGVLVGTLVELAVIRRFDRSPRLILTVATLGLAQLLGGFQFLIPTWLGSSGILGGVDTAVPGSFTVEPILVTGDHLMILAMVPAAMALVGWFLTRTPSGIAIRAAAESADRARLLGIPVGRLQTLVWAAVGALSALTFVLRVPFTGASPDVVGGLSALLPALAAAVVARMHSLPVAVAAGLGLGVVEQVTLWNVDRASILDPILLVIILAGLLLVSGQADRARAGAASSWAMSGLPRRSLDRWSKPAARAGLATASVVALLAPMHMAASSVLLVSVAFVWAIAGLSVVMLTGWSGHASLGQFAFVGVGAITAGNLIGRWNLDLILATLAAGAVGALVALIVGLPALRIQGLFLAVTTLAFAITLDSWLLNPLNFPEIVPQSLDRPMLAGRIDLESERAMYYLCFAVLVLAVLAVHRLQRGRLGRVLVAVRDNERAAAAMAVPLVDAKLAAFVISGAVAGVAGSLHVLVLHGARVGSFQPGQSVELFSMVVIGGTGSIAGALAGILGLRLLEQVVDPAYRLLVTGTGVLLILWLVPTGLAGIARTGWNRFLARADRPTRAATSGVDRGAVSLEQIKVTTDA